MNKLIKIADMSSKYVFARTLRYYEDMELITSTHSDKYGYKSTMKPLSNGWNKF